MNIKNFKRMLAIVMTLVCFFAYVVFEPASALAENAREEKQLSENINEINSIWSQDGEKYSPLAGELTDERDEAVKRFRREDGAIELVSYSSPVHYMKDGEWAAIDNTLKYDEMTGRFVNTANDFIVELGANEPVLNVSYNGETLSITGIDLPDITDKELSAAVEEREKKEDLTDEEKDNLLRFPEELSSALAYYTADGKETGLEYKLSGKSLSEYITVAERPETVPTYVYTFTTTLIPRIEENVVFFENEKGETVMYFSAPVMADANGNECFDFTVELAANEDGSYTYILTPDEAWLMNEETVYPVVIDPDVSTNFRSNVQNSYVSPDEPNFQYGSNSNTKYSLKVGGDNAYRTLIRLEDLGTFAPGDVIIHASINLTRYSTQYDQYGKEIDAYRMNGTWNESTVTWNTYSAINGGHPYDDSRIETFALSSYGSTVTFFDITDLYKRWYAGETPNYGVMLTSSNYAVFFSSRNSTSEDCHPYFRVVYVNSTGLEGRFSYSGHSVGRAGSGNVNLFSGNLTFSFDDAAINNGVMPISVSHVYNTNDKDTDIGYGYGWRLNYSQEINEVELTDRDGTQTYYEFIDGDGTRHYYKKKSSSSSTYVNELDKDSTLTINSSDSTITIKDKGDNKLVFKYGTVNGKKHGRLIRVEDANGNRTVIAYKSTTISNMRISSITEKLSANSSNGQSITLTYGNDDRLSAMTVPNGLNMSYGYGAGYGNLNTVTAADGQTCNYTYSSHKITKVRSIDDYNISYTYDSRYRVTSIQEKADTTPGNSLSYDYAWNVTTVTDNQDRNTVYQFNDAAQPVSVRDNEGNAVYAAYGDSQNPTKLSAVSKMQHTIVNLLKNPSFDNNSTSPWTLSSAATDSKHHTGRYSVKLSTNGSAVQTVSVTSGETYTFSAYFSGAATGKLQILNGSTVIAESDPVETYGTAGTDWARGSVTFTAPSASIKVKLINAGTSAVYADSAQLEAGETPNRVNLLVNSDFSDGTNGYNTHNFGTGDTVVTTADSTHPDQLSASVLKITGSYDQEYVSQTLYVTGKEGDSYSFGGWCASDSVPRNKQYDYSAMEYVSCGERSLRVSFYNGDTLVNGTNAYFDPDTTDWQFVSSSAIAEGAYTKIVFSVRFLHSRNKAYFDGVQLYREEFSQGYVYDSNGNLTKYTSLLGDDDDFEYDDNNNLTKATDPLDNYTNYTYDPHHNQLTATTKNTNDATVSEVTNTYDSNGNVTSTKVGSNSNYIEATTAYDNASALASAVTDARGNSVSYTYNSSTRQQTKITDAKGNESTYAYGNAAAMLRLASLTSDGTGTVEYGYDQYGKLTSISRSTTVYSFTYDNWGNVVDTKVGSTTLSTNIYDQYGRLSQVNYGNGFKTRYEYDSLDRTSKIYQGTAANGSNTPAYEFIYNGEGDLYELRNYKTLRASFFEYDHAGRCMASTEKKFTVDSNGAFSSYAGTAAGYAYEYDANNNLTKLTCFNDHDSWETTYTYDGANRPLTTTLNNGKVIKNTYDIMGRITSKALKNSSNATTSIYKTTVTYVAGANDSQTALVATYQNGSDAAYSYSYDANGNITSITKGSLSFTYEYDAANQLVRENLYYGSGNANNATYTYEYDDWGNILNKKRYTYTTGSLGSVLNTINYGYGSSQWKDRLSSYNGQSISYDAMGNPTSYLG
ncbi:MAG: DNRLRE domain-containing protein, partial [Ruminococcus sp.]|nr:DNRLRE domain-containing protein [Ruminococcus sp.]